MIWTSSVTECLMSELRQSGLVKAELLDDGRLLLRTEACLPRVRLRGNEAFAEWADVMITADGNRLTFRIEHPDAGEVMHPNWDANGYWRASRAVNYEYTDNASFTELLRYMIGGLKMKTSCFTLDEPVNRNAVSWCYSHGKVPIKVISTKQGGQDQSGRPPVNGRPRMPMTISRVSISPERFEE